MRMLDSLESACRKSPRTTTAGAADTGASDPMGKGRGLLHHCKGVPCSEILLLVGLLWYFLCEVQACLSLHPPALARF